MKSGSVLGIVLIVLGALALAYQGFTYTTQKRVLDVGPIHAVKDEHKTVPLPPIVGGVALLAGLVVLFASNKNS